MSGWFARWFGKAAPPAPAVPSAVPPPPSTWTASTPAPAPAGPGFGARRPLVGPDGRIAGFEFRLPEATEQRLRARPDPRAQAAHAVALLAAMRPTLQAGRAALARLPAALLARPAVLEQAAPGLLLLLTELPDDAGALSDAAGAWRARGARLGWPAEVGEGLPAAGDFVLLRAGPGGLEALLRGAQRWRETRPELMRIAAELESIDEIERALQAGCALASGRLDGAAAPPRARGPLQATARHISALLNDVALDRDLAHVAEGVRADVALSYRLLRYANSAAFGLARSVDSVEQAVMLVGRKELYRWLSVMLLASADQRSSSRALHEIALARACLLEALARERGSDPPEALFTLGLLSLLDLLLQAPLAEALAPLRLGEEARQALLERGGPWRRYLELAAHLERHDLAALESLAAEFGGSERVLAVADAAWRRAAELSHVLD